MTKILMSLPKTVLQDEHHLIGLLNPKTLHLKQRNHNMSLWGNLAKWHFVSMIEFVGGHFSFFELQSFIRCKLFISLAIRQISILDVTYLKVSTF